MAKKNRINEEELNRLFKERMKEYEAQFLKEHTTVIEMKYGKTFIKFFNMDDININISRKISKLLDLMNVEYAYGITGIENETFYSFNEEDTERAAFIQTFIDNGYRLMWK